MSSRIYFINNDAGLQQQVRQALSNSGLHLEIIPINALNESNTEPGNINLIIINTQGFSQEEWHKLYLLKNESSFRHIPVLALVEEQPLQLRQKLVELGVEDYLTVPFDQLDMRVRVNAILSFKSPPVLQNEHDDLTGILQSFRELLEQLNQPTISFRSEDFYGSILNGVTRMVNAGYVYYFEITGEESLQLKFRYPQQFQGQSLQLSMQEISGLEKAIRMCEPTILNTLSANSSIVTYLKSILNVKARSLLIYPVVSAGRTKAVLMVIRTTDDPFSDLNFLVLGNLSELLSYNIRLSEYREKLNRQSAGLTLKPYYAYLEKIINYLDVGIIVIDPQQRIDFINDVALKILEVSRGQSLQKPLPELIAGENFKTIFSFENPSPELAHKTEVEVKLPRGEKALLEILVLPLGREGERQGGYIISFKDVTINRETQEEIYLKNRLTSLGVLASGIAHEIRNPLAGSGLSGR
ncbi:MAG: PAS domain-containing protein [Calditrichia bacterium]